MKITHSVILASSSPRRIEILKNTGFNVTAVEHRIDEDSIAKSLSGLPPKEFAKELAKAKALSMKDSYNNQIIIGADTIVLVDDIILGKPRDNKEAKEFIRMLSGRTHSVITGFCVIYGNNQYAGYEESKIEVKELTESDIAEYVEIENVLDAAGAYKIQGFFSIYVKRIEGCWNNIVGLPVSRIYDEIKKLHLYI